VVVIDHSGIILLPEGADHVQIRGDGADTLAGVDVLSFQNAPGVYVDELLTAGDVIDYGTSLISVTVNGGALDDILTGGDGGSTDTIYGDGDTLNGGDGNNYIDGGSGDDRITATGTGSNVLLGGAGHDTVIGGDGNDIIDGYDGPDELYGNGGNDTFTGGFGDDTISGGSGNDSINGGANSNLLNGDSGNDTVVAQDTSSTLFGGEGNDVLNSGTGQYGNSLLVGGDDSDNLTGFGTLYGDSTDPNSLSGGNDTLSGTGQLYGGAGNDSLSGFGALYGGAGDDTIVASSVSPETAGYFQIIGDGAGNSLLQVDTGQAGELQQVERHIRQLAGQLPTVLQLVRPLEMLQHLGGFQRKRNSNIAPRLRPRAVPRVPALSAHKIMHGLR
jgi:Ca2+-binding RTX toxin-like protein